MLSCSSLAWVLFEKVWAPSRRAGAPVLHGAGGHGASVAYPHTWRNLYEQRYRHISYLRV